MGFLGLEGGRDGEGNIVLECVTGYERKDDFEREG
jgi:hypothetical protein